MPSGESGHGLSPAGLHFEIGCFQTRILSRQDPLKSPRLDGIWRALGQSGALGVHGAHTISLPPSVVARPCRLSGSARQSVPPDPFAAAGPHPVNGHRLFQSCN